MRQERWGLPEGGLSSTFNRAEMRAAERTQNRSLFWLETVVAADTPRGVQDGRRRRPVPARGEPPSPPLDDRPPAALPPPVPARARTADPIVPLAGVGRRGRAPARAPSARMKGVPVRRVTIPRIPAPPEVGPARPPRRRHAATSALVRPALEPDASPPSTEPHQHAACELGRDGPPAAARGHAGARANEPVGPPSRTLYPMLRADNAEVADPPVGPQVRGAAGRRPGHRARRSALLSFYLNDIEEPTPRRS